MLLGPVQGHAYLGGAAVWGVIMAAEGAGAITAGLVCLGRRPARPLVIATIGTFCYALPDFPMALHAAAPWVAVAAFCCGAGAATSSVFSGTVTQQQVPPAKLARVNSLTLFPSYGIGVIGYAIDGPLAAAVGPQAVFAVGAVYGLVSSAAVFMVRPVRVARWPDAEPPALSASAPPPAGPRRRPAGPPPSPPPPPAAPDTDRPRV
jgi:hypothetical protein